MYAYNRHASFLKEYMDLRKEQGADVSQVDKRLTECIKQAIDEVKLLPVVDSFGYVEPVELSLIKNECPSEVQLRKQASDLTNDELMDKIAGAWFGRSAGCALGIPVEGWSKGNIREWAQKLGQYPLRDYWRDVPHDREHYNNMVSDFLKDNIKFMGSDDDITYTILGLHILDEYGVDFTWDDVAKEWVDHLPVACTAEAVALDNIKKGIAPPESGINDNPFCEWIGAQIRADIWGYVVPGNPEKAAEMAYIDSRVSHIKNGSYGEMFFAAAIAAAFVEDDLHAIIHAGLAQIPAKCRLAEAINDTVTWSDSCSDWEEVFQNIVDKYGHYNGVHTINNACVCIMALLKGELDFGKSIGISVMAGWDTDCNAATVGSLLGVVLGRKKMPAQWYECFNGKLHSYVKGFEWLTFDEVIEKTYQLAERQCRVR